jgi:hypothetical protein
VKRDGKPSRVGPKVATSQMENAGLKKREHMPGSIYREMLAASDPALTEAVVEMPEACAAILDTAPQYVRSHHGWPELRALRAAMARITVETSDAG